MAGFSSNLLFQNINDDLNASLAAADELSREFNSMLKEASSNTNNNKPSESQTSSSISRESPLSSAGSTSSKPSSSSFCPIDSSSSNVSSPTRMSNSPGSSPKTSRTSSPLPKARTDSYSQRSGSPVQTSYSMLNPYDSQMSVRSPRADLGPSPLTFRSSSPMPLNQPASSTLPRNFPRHMQSDEGMQRQKSPARWNETDLDVSYEKKPHHTYNKTEWLRPSMPNSSWRESNLDGPPVSPNPKKNTSLNLSQGSYSSLPRNACISVPPDVPSQSPSHFYPQPILSRISVPPISSQSRQNKPIPLSVILRLQNPHYRAMAVRQTRALEAEAGHYQPAPSFHREAFPQPVFQPPEPRQPAAYNDGDVDAELERLEFAHQIPVILSNVSRAPGGGESDRAALNSPRPLSPTRLQPVVAPEAQQEEIPNLEELLRIRAEIPRALKRRGSVDYSKPEKSVAQSQPSQYKHLIDKLFRNKDRKSKGDYGSETYSSSDGEDSAPPAEPSYPSTVIKQDTKNYQSILRKAKRKSSGMRARLNPLVLLLDGALQGELETVQKAVQEMTDPSQANDEGITGLHNSICAGHYNIVDFLVRIGANISAPDSHGWTPLHCAASCNDLRLCEYLVRNGAAVMARTESDGATASQKCDPYAQAFMECESFLKGVEEAMGVDNSGVLYALWSHAAQLNDELSFKEGDMVTILRKADGSDWWWASLCGKEGFVPNNYFGLFPKIRPKSLC